MVFSWNCPKTDPITEMGVAHTVWLCMMKGILKFLEALRTKDFRASGLGQVRRLTAATAAITLACLFVEMLCYVLGRLHSSCVLSTRIGLHSIEVINETLVNDDLKKIYIFMFKVISSENVSFQSYQNKNL